MKLPDHRPTTLEEPREVLSGEGAAGPFAQVQAYLAIGAALTGSLGALLPHPSYFDVKGLLAIQAVSVAYGVFVLALRNRISFRFLRIGNLFAAILTTLAVYFSGDSAGAYAIFYLWIGFYVFYYPVSRLQAAANIGFAVVNYAVAIAITPTPPASDHVGVAFFAIVTGTLITAGVLLSYLRQRVDRLMGRLVEASRTDPLTGLPNRVALHETLERELERAEPEHRHISVLMLDIDRFKRINEREGLAGGDRLLRKMASMLEKSTRRIDFVARSGGEEFAMLLPETDQHHAFMVAEQLLERIRREAPPSQPNLTASVGVATYPEHGGDLASLLSAADQALHAAKALGRDRAVIYSPEVTTVLGAMAGRRSVQAQAQLATVLSLAEALDQRDSGTARHSQTVGALCELMARELGLPPDQVDRVRLAGVLHDIGKIGVPDSILRKPGPLTEEERSEMQRHPEIGARILSSGEMDDIRQWVLAHHERPDGNGYPKGLSAEEIPLEASILAVADAYEAMTSDRVYRLGIGAEAAQQELIDNSGTQFEPRVVRALLHALDRDPALLKV